MLLSINVMLTCTCNLSTVLLTTDILSNNVHLNMQLRTTLTVVHYLLTLQIVRTFKIETKRVSKTIAKRKVG